METCVFVAFKQKCDLSEWESKRASWKQSTFSLICFTDLEGDF